MQDYKSWRIILKPRSPLHIGNKEGIYNTTEYVIHSDTLFSGIINCYSMLFGRKETESLVNSFCTDDVPFRISSAMPYWKDIYYVFKPLSLDLTEKLQTDDHKKIKKVKFIPENTLIDGFNNDRYQVVGQFIVTEEKYTDDGFPCFKSRELARIDVDRITYSTNIFYYSQCVYGNETGLWFYLKISDELSGKVLSAIKLLCDEGIGGERSIGLGSFDFEKTEAEEVNLVNCDSFVNISVFSPKNEEELGVIMDYEIAERAGYVYSVFGNKDAKKKKVKVLLEGSTFSGMVEGRLVDVTPNGFNSHRVFRYALSYLLPYKS